MQIETIRISGPEGFATITRHGINEVRVDLELNGEAKTTKFHNINPYGDSNPGIYKLAFRLHTLLEGFRPLNADDTQDHRNILYCFLN